jgi:hypothetical protein
MTRPRLARVVIWLAAATLTAGTIPPGNAQPTQSAPRLLPEGRDAFLIDLDTTGGFTGRGRGGVSLASDGTAVAARGMGSNRSSSTCRTTMTNEEVTTLRDAVTTARREPWPPTFVPSGDNGCCDRMKWTLRLQQRDGDDGIRTFQTIWYDGNEKRLPAELATIRDLAVRVMTRALRACGGPRADRRHGQRG